MKYVASASAPGCCLLQSCAKVLRTLADRPVVPLLDCRSPHKFASQIRLLPPEALLVAWIQEPPCPANRLLVDLRALGLPNPVLVFSCRSEEELCRTYPLFQYHSCSYVFLGPAAHLANIFRAVATLTPLQPEMVSKIKFQMQSDCEGILGSLLEIVEKIKTAREKDAKDNLEALTQATNSMPLAGLAWHTFVDHPTTTEPLQLKQLVGSELARLRADPHNRELLKSLEMLFREWARLARFATGEISS